MKDECKTISELDEKISTKLEILKSEVDDLYKTVYKGNGKPSLLTQVSATEGKLKGFRERFERDLSKHETYINDKLEAMSKETTLKFDSLHQKIENKFGKYEGWAEGKFNNLENLIKLDLSNKQTDRAGNWSVRAALISGIIAIVTVATTLIFNWLQTF